MLLYISWASLEIELTCKKLGKNLRNCARSQDFKILSISSTIKVNTHTQLQLKANRLNLEPCSYSQVTIAIDNMERALEMKSMNE